MGVVADSPMFSDSVVRLRRSPIISNTAASTAASPLNRIRFED